MNTYCTLVTILLVLFSQHAYANSNKLLCLGDSQCNDNNDCTIDTCILLSGLCVYTYASSGTPCSDGLFCTTGDVCDNSGVCRGTQPTCTGQCNSHCNETAKTCFSPSGTSCDDGLWCNGQDSCNGAGNCTVHTGNPCATSSGACMTTNCTESTHCLLPAGSACTSDGNQCTSDTCDSQGNCMHTFLNGTTCNDGNGCTLNDVCSGSGCAGTWNPQCTCANNSQCNDNNTCTIDICSNGTCIHNPNNGVSCDDGNWCNGHEVCGGGVCLAGTPPCGSSNPCNSTCNNSTRTCNAPVNTTCDDNIYCNGNDFCNGLGVCVPSNVSPCGGECKNTCNETARGCADPKGTSCNDGLYCNGADTCDGSGNCVPSDIDPCAGYPQCQNSCDETADACVNTTAIECQGDFCGGALWICLSGVCSAVGERCNSSFPICDSVNHQCISNSTSSNTSGTTGVEASPSASPANDNNTPGQKSGNNFMVIGAGAGGGIALIGGVCIGGICVAKAKKKKDKKEKSSQESDEKGTTYDKGIPDTGFYADVSGGNSLQDSIIWNSEIRGIIVLNLLGSGNFGEVYKGIWPKDKDTAPIEVALKKLKNDDHFADFVEEAAMLSQLDHRNVVRYFGVFNQTTKYIVTEFMNRGSLLDLLQCASFTQYDYKNMALDAAKGLAYLHSKSVIHRDLACRNLLVHFVDGKYTVKISDFGMARAIEKYYYSKSDMMPIRWCAPEVLCFRKYSQESDAWSFGVCLWEIYAKGQDPYLGYSNQEVVDLVQKGHRLAKPAGCPDSMYTLMRMCWLQDRSERPSFDVLVSKISQADVNKVTTVNRTESTRAVLSKFVEPAMQNVAIMEQQVTIFEDEDPPSYKPDCIPMNEM